MTAAAPITNHPRRRRVAAMRSRHELRVGSGSLTVVMLGVLSSRIDLDYLPVACISRALAD